MSRGTRRQFLMGSVLTATALAAPIVTAQTSASGRWINQYDGTKPPDGHKIPRRLAKTTPLFLSPPFGNAQDARKNNQKATFPNALAIMTDGPHTGCLWIGEQKLSGVIANLYPGLPEPEDLTERAWLVDWNGKVLKTVTTPKARNTGGMAYGDGCLWRATEFPGDGNEGIYQTDMNSKLVSFRQIPMGPPRDGGGAHGAMWVDGKLWIVANRLHGMVRIDPKSWIPDFYIAGPPEYPRFHDCAWDDGTIWQVAGNRSMRPSENVANLLRYDATTGELIEIVDFVPGSADPHGLTLHDGKLISCDAGNHPNWKIFESPTAGWVFSIDFV